MDMDCPSVYYLKFRFYKANVTMEIIIIIAALINFVVLIMFFQLARNVEIIRGVFRSKVPGYWLEEYNKHSHLHREKEALHALQEFIWASINKNKSSYESLKHEYSERFSALGSKFPDYPY